MASSVPNLFGGTSSGGTSTVPNLFSGGGSSAPKTLDDLVRAKVMKQNGMEDQQFGPWIGNLFGDVKDLAGGISHLVGLFPHDLGRAVADVIPGRQDWGVISDNPNDRFQLPTVAAGLIPGIAHDYAHRYGGLSNITEGMTQHPLSYLLDLLGLGSVAGKGAELAGKAALSATETGLSEAANITNKLQEGARAAEVVLKPRAAYRAGLRGALEKAPGETPAWAKLLPGTELKRMGLQGTFGEGGTNLVRVVQAENPVTRLALTPVKFLGKQKLGDLEAAIGEIEGKIAQVREIGGPAASRDVADLVEKKNLLEVARKNELTRIERPGIANLNGYVMAKRWMAHEAGANFANRLKATSVYANIIKPYMEADPNLEKTGSVYTLRLDAQIPGYERQGFVEPQLAGVKSAEVGAREPAMAGGGVAAATRPVPVTQAIDPADVNTLGDAVGGESMKYIDRLKAQVEQHPEYAPHIEELTGEAYDAMHRLARLGRNEVDSLDPRYVAEPGYQMADRLFLQDLKHITEAVESGATNPEWALERNAIGVRLAHGAEWAQDGTDTLVGGPSLKEIHDAIRASDMPAPTYFPFMDPENLRSSDWFTSKRPIGANIFARDPHMLRTRGELLKSGAYVRNPMEAFTRRAARGSRMVETANMFAHMVNKFGKPIASAEDIPSGYRVVAPDLLFLQKRSAMAFNEELDKLLMQGIDHDSALASALKTVTLKNQEDIAKLLADGNIKMYAVPEVVVKRLDDAARWAGLTGRKVGTYYDTVMAGWRGLVLAGSPRWLVNNFLGNIVFQLMQGAKTADVMKLLGANFKKMLGGESKMLKTLRENVPGFEDVAGTGFSSSQIAQYEPIKPALRNTALGDVLGKAAKTRPVKGLMAFGRNTRTLNGVIEDSFREASYLTAAERQAGMSIIKRTGGAFISSEKRVQRLMATGFDEHAARSALDEVNHFFGDYGKLGPFERHVLRRYMVPFWGFYKHQAKLLLTFPFEYPLRAQMLKQIANVNNDMMAQYGPLPDWLEGAVPFGPPGQQGETQFFSGRGPNPFSASFDDWGSMLSPILKMGIERYVTGKSLLTGENFSDPNVVTPYGSDQPFRIVRDDQGNVVNMVPVEGHVLPSIFEQLLGNIPQYTAAENILAGGKKYDTTSMFDLLRGKGKLTDETGANVSPSNALEQLLKLAGLGTTGYDLNKYQERLAALQQSALSAAQKRPA